MATDLGFFYSMAEALGFFYCVGLIYCFCYGLDYNFGYGLDYSFGFWRELVFNQDDFLGYSAGIRTLLLCYILIQVLGIGFCGY